MRNETQKKHEKQEEEKKRKRYNYKKIRENNEK